VIYYISVEYLPTYGYDLALSVLLLFPHLYTYTML